MSENDTSAQPFREDPLDTPAHNPDADHGTPDQPIDPTATGVDVRAIAHEIEGWGGSSMPEHELTPSQVEHLQDRPEPIGAGETGRALHGDNGNADPTWQADAPQTQTPDTSLGHEGGRRYHQPGDDGSGPTGADGRSAAADGRSA